MCSRAEERHRANLKQRISCIYLIDSENLNGGGLELEVVPLVDPPDEEPPDDTLPPPPPPLPPPPLRLLKSGICMVD